MISSFSLNRLVIFLGICLMTLSAKAADFPSQAIRVVVPFPPGGSTDLVTRALAAELSTVLKQTVVVDNKAGAGSLLGSEFVAKATPDGHTLLMAGLTNVFLPYVFKNLRFHPVDDFSNIGLVADLPNVIAVNSNTIDKQKLVLAMSENVFADDSSHFSYNYVWRLRENYTSDEINLYNKKL